jgi:catechol 2,3-dioxygenase-like lactoylglutathione lyase family enzyme
MTASAKPIPKGFHTVTPYLVVRNAAQAIEFYKKALGAEELMRMATPNGKIGHAELKIGDSIIFLTDESPEMGTKSPQTLGGTAASLYLYVEDVDKDSHARSRYVLGRPVWLIRGSVRAYLGPEHAHARSHGTRDRESGEGLLRADGAAAQEDRLGAC